MTSAALLQQPIEVSVPLLHPARHRAANLNRRSAGRSAGASTRDEGADLKLVNVDVLIDGSYESIW